MAMPKFPRPVQETVLCLSFNNVPIKNRANSPWNCLWNILEIVTELTWHQWCPHRILTMLVCMRVTMMAWTRARKPTRFVGTQWYFPIFSLNCPCIRWLISTIIQEVFESLPGIKGFVGTSDTRENQSTAANDQGPASEVMDGFKRMERCRIALDALDAQKQSQSALNPLNWPRWFVPSLNTLWIIIDFFENSGLEALLLSEEVPRRFHGRLCSCLF